AIIRLLLNHIAARVVENRSAHFDWGIAYAFEPSASIHSGIAWTSLPLRRRLSRDTHWFTDTYI
ncbi:MAG: hypothetical protein WA673_04915, partial [Candidatus Acidiferrales bacterium]